MYLSKLEMVGFKSFALKTDMSFQEGVTAIVGPNGCGKTNVVDAIRWVLGEQKTSMLRADSMDQVIFNGSKNRKPLGLAEVSLTIENNKQILPTEYSQVVITRRLFRNGESQYLLNKTQCRLRDIIDLFMDTGMGADAYSVIELKMIETILSDKADERRHLFEEAAGVTKYKARRKEAQRKLDAAQRDIARVQDIVREVQKTVNSLGRQADKARQHQELSTRLRELDILVFAVEYAQEYVHLKACQERIQTIREQKEAAEDLLTKAEIAVEQSEAAHAQREQDLRTAMEREADVRTQVSEAQQQLTLVNERINANQRALQRLDSEQNESSNQQRSTEDELVSVQQRLEQLFLEVEQAQKNVVAAREQSTQSANLVQLARQELQQKREQHNSARQTVAEHSSSLEKLRVQYDGLGRRLRDLQHQLQQAHERKEQVERNMQQEQDALPTLDADLATAEQKLQAAEEQQQRLRLEQESLQTEVDFLRTTLAHTQASLEFLTGLVDTTESSKFLMSTSEWKPSGEKLTLAEIINSSEELRVAIEAALGESARYFVVANKNEAQEAIAALLRNNVGKATFLCRDTIPAMPEPPTIPSNQAIVGWASEVITTDDQLRNAARGILGKTLVVRTLQDAWDAISNTVADTAVTLSGEIVHRSGAVRGGSSSRTEGVRVGRKERIAALSTEQDELSAKLSNTEERIRAVKSELQTIDVRKLSDDVRRAALLRNDKLQRLDSFKARLNDVVLQADNVQQESQKFVQEQQEIQRQMAEAQERIDASGDAVKDAEQAVHQAIQKLEQTEKHSDELYTAARNAEIQSVRLSSESQTLQSNQQRLTNQQLSIEQRVEQRAKERENLQDQLVDLAAQKTEAEAFIVAVTQMHVQSRTVREGLEITVKEALQEFHAAGDAQRAQRKQLDGIVQQGHEADLKFNEVRLRMESLARKATEELDIPVPEEPAPPEVDVSIEETRVEVQELRRKLTSMGNVNFLALEEHERENERLQFLNTQLADLLDGERTLNETILEINITAREKFVSTFTQIRENFISLFKMLFSEDDEADLQMIEAADNDPLECTIDIMAKPRGKRPHSIEMLSGGEKTLTAIALLFGIYLVKPSPFCILDEVDAPLDDANIDRYLKIIRKFAENTQFMMITHNKKTMEAADTLYGVTMEETAVSKVVSVQLSNN